MAGFVDETGLKKVARKKRPWSAMSQEARDAAKLQAESDGLVAFWAKRPKSDCPHKHLPLLQAWHRGWQIGVQDEARLLAGRKEKAKQEAIRDHEFVLPAG